MNVRELREMLEMFDDEMEVVFARDSKDYWRTTVADSLEDVVDGVVEHSAYHNQYKLVEDEDGNMPDFPSADQTRVVVIR